MDALKDDQMNEERWIELEFNALRARPAICGTSSAAEQNIRNIFLGTTSRFLAAHRFYEKNGFELVEREALPETFPVMAVDTRFYRLPL